MSYITKERVTAVIFWIAALGFVGAILNPDIGVTTDPVTFILPLLLALPYLYLQFQSGRIQKQK